jgi:hypothetical protein
VVSVRHTCRVTADMLSIASLGCAALSGIAYFFAVQKTLLLYGDIIECRRSYRYESERSHAHPSRRTV